MTKDKYRWLGGRVAQATDCKSVDEGSNPSRAFKEVNMYTCPVNDHVHYDSFWMMVLDIPRMILKRIQGIFIKIFNKS